MLPKNIIQILGLSFFLIFLILSCEQNKSVNKELIKEVRTESKYHYEIIILASGQFGYDIYENKKKIIHQPNMPSVQGNNGFSQEIHAQKTAELVIQKLEAQIMPPSISHEEIQGIVGASLH